MPRAQRSLNAQRTILKAIQAKKQVNIADEMGVSEASLSNTLNNPIPNTDNATQLTRFCDLLAASGLKVVPEDVACVSAEKMAALKYFARIGLNCDDAEEAETLHWD